MADSMSRPALLLSLKSMLMDSAERFDDPALDRHLLAAARDLGRRKPRIKRATLTVESEKSDYTAPADMTRPYAPLWGKAELVDNKPWNDDHPGRLPHMTLEDGTVYLTPPPTAKQITLLGTDYEFRYVAPWVIGETADATNIPEAYRDLVLIRATAAAMQDLCNRNVTKPVRLGECGGQPAANGTAGALAEALMKRFESMAV